MRVETCVLFDFNGTLVDDVYQHVPAWSQALNPGDPFVRVADPPQERHKRRSLH